MAPFDYHCPTRIIFGPGRLAELGSRVAELGVRRVLVVSDPGVIEAGHTRCVLDLLAKAGLEITLFDGVQENPTTDNVDLGLGVAKDFQPEALIAVGGGSSMDCCKGINFLYSCGGCMQDYWGVGKATANMLPMVAVPTTAGTGSEAQSFALISDSETHVKMACGDKRAAFRLAILDPELTLTQPARVTALTGIDAISHTVETLVTKRRNQVSIAFSQAAWRLLSRGLPRVFTDPNDLYARGWVQQGACFAGLAIENSMLGSAHALANPLTAHYGIVHGEAVGLMLPHVVTFNASRHEASKYAYAELLTEIDVDNSDDFDVAVGSVAHMLNSIRMDAGLAGKLSDVGVAKDSLPQLAADAAKQWTGTFNPVEMSEHDFLQLYEAAF